MIHVLHCKDINFFTQIQMFMKETELMKLEVICPPTLQKTMESFIKDFTAFKKIKLTIDPDCNQNLIDDHEILEYFCKRQPTFSLCKIAYECYPTTSKLKDKKYIYVEDYKGDKNIVTLAEKVKELGYNLYANHSFCQATPNTTIDKHPYSLIQKWGIIQHAAGYIGYETSLFAPAIYVKRNYLKVCILKNNDEIQNDMFLRFHPEENHDFMYNNVIDYIYSLSNEETQEVN
jgi:hypothetical protein